MGADYTDGGGWAKLDGTAAVHLSRCIDGFTTRTKSVYTMLLLMLFSCTGRDGTVNVGIRTLAERAGVSVKQARGFMEHLEDTGVLVELGKKPQDRRSPYVTRSWFWLLDGGVPQKGHRGVPGVPSFNSGNERQKGTGCARHNSSTSGNGNLKGTYQIIINNQIDGGGSATAAPPPNESEINPPKPQEISNPLLKQRADLFLEGGE